MDNRGQSIGISRFFLSLMVGAILYWITDRVTTPVIAQSRNVTNNATANQATEWFHQGVEAMPLAIALLTFIGIIMLSVFQREVLR